MILLRLTVLLGFFFFAVHVDSYALSAGSLGSNCCGLGASWSGCRSTGVGTRDLGHFLHVTLGKSLHPSGSRLLNRIIFSAAFYTEFFFGSVEMMGKQGVDFHVNFRYLVRIQVMALIYTGMLTSHLSK